ncbi:MAG: T9SS type A sorting domain-containing protein [Bacteroidia bacterium]|nr:T9SS type A sorting domain-containing protein [Bacteroidia bacterium]
MKKGFLFLFLFVCILPRLQAQDLELVTGSLIVTPISIHIGSNMSVSFEVRNNGGVNAGKTYTGIYLSTSGSLVGATLISEISLEELSPGSIAEVKYIHPIPYTISGGNNFVVVSLNNQNSISETNTSNNISVSSVINIDPAPWAQQNLPYPIIFIHGFNDDNETWDTLITFMQNTYGYSYGGKMDFCLNADSSNSTSELFDDFRDFTDSTGHEINPLCDMYTINFSNNPDGSYPYNESFLSHQAAAHKQGYAVKKAIEHVLDKTGKDKVILVCHSMGGLAARAYLQNPAWNQQPDNKKHVAKLCTIGTPHGGSNIGSGLPSGVAVYAAAIALGYDLRSDAMRDLRTSYYFSNFFPSHVPRPSTFLFGGKEDLFYMLDQAHYLPSATPPFSLVPTIPIYFYNSDVNCDGVASGQIHSGLNSKSIPADINYSCLIGTGEVFPIVGDGVVTDSSQNINNFLQVDADLYELPDPALNWTFNPDSLWHVILNKQVYNILMGMDEPKEYTNRRAYNISSGQLYYGNLTYQPVTALPRDFDNFEFNMPSSGILSLEVFNIPTPLFSINIFNASGNNVYSVNNNGKSYLNIGANLSSGKYMVVLSGIPTTDSWKYPYAFRCTFTPASTTCTSTTYLTTSAGVLSDGSAASNYNNNSDCKWLIKPSGATSVTLDFSAFNLDNTDTLIMYDGSYITSPILAKLTGNSLPASITSTGGRMLIRFVSDVALTSTGWDASYTATVIPTYCSGGNILTTSSGSFTDGSDTSNYSNNSQCSWLVFPANALSVTVNFTVFNIDSIDDVVNVYDGLDNSFPLLGTFTGNNLPPSITSTGGALFVEFLTNDTITRTGWRAAYTSVLLGGNTAITEYEYWFDDDYANAINIPVVPQQTLNINSAFPTNSLSYGLHTLHVRFKDNNSNWSSVTSKYFYKENKLPVGANYLTQCQYWIDDDFANHVDSFITSAQYQYGFSPYLPVSNLSYGLHTFNIRFLDNNSTWSSTVSKYFFKSTMNPTGLYRMASYRYWFDNNTANLTNKVFSSPQTQQNLYDTLSTSGLINGTHLFHIQFMDELSQWSSVLTDTFNVTNCINNPTISGANVICSGTTTTINAGPGFSSYIWSNGSTSQTISVTTSGLYTVTVTDANGCTGSDTINLTTQNSPIPIISGINIICDGDVSLLDAGSGYQNYLWSTSDTLQSISATVSGLYSVIVTDANGCTGIDSFSLLVNSLPSITINPSGSLCNGSSITLDAGGLFSSYLWSTSSSIQTIVVSQLGTYSVTVTDSNSCSNTDSLFVPLISVDTSITTNGITFTALANNAGYQWIYCDSVLVIGETNQTFAASQNGSYAVIISQNGCVDTSSCFQTTSVGSFDIGNNNSITFYPNPTNDLLYVVLKGKSDDTFIITLINKIGQNVLQKTLSGNNATLETELNLKQLAIGLYYLKIEGKKTYHVIKIQKI